jgi:hypothetical protein
MEVAYRPDLPDYGMYLQWPLAGTAWIHPEDVELAERWIPGPRVFRRFHYDGQYYHLQYGNQVMRLMPSMWTAAPKIDVQVGDQVELLSHFGQQDPGLATIQDIHCRRAEGQVEFWLRRGEMTLPQSFGRSDFRPITLRHHLRVGYYIHQPPKFFPPVDLEYLVLDEI